MSQSYCYILFGAGGGGGWGHQVSSWVLVCHVGFMRGYCRGRFSRFLLRISGYLDCCSVIFLCLVCVVGERGGKWKRERERECVCVCVCGGGVLHILGHFGCPA